MRVGAPELSFGAPDLGIDQFARLFSHEGLSGLSPEGHAVPRLAEGWTWSDNGKKLRVRLRPGVRSHDGPLTARIVADAIRSAAADPGNRAQYWSLAQIESVDPTGDAEVTISLSQPSGSLPEDLDLPLGFGPSKAGTGPFRVVSQSDAEVVLERFDQYYRDKPNVPRVVITPYPTLRTAWASLLRGNVDMVTNVPANAVGFVESARVVVASFPRVYQHLIAFNSARTPFENPTVRLALNLAVDREQLLDRVFAKRGQPATGPLWPSHWAYDHSATPYAFDPARARSLLDAAGLPAAKDAGQGRAVRFSFTCLVPANFVTEERIALELERQLHGIGVEIRFEVISSMDYLKRFRTGNFDAVLIDMISGPTFGRPYLFWHSGRDEAGFNVFGYRNVEADRLFNVLRETTDDDVTRRAAAQLQRVFSADPPALFLVWNERIRAVSRDFQSLVAPGTDPIRALWGWTPARDGGNRQAPP